MTKTYCDICGMETKVEEMDVAAAYKDGRWLRDTIDVCSHCKSQIKYLCGRVEHEYVKRKGNYSPTLD